MRQMQKVLWTKGVLLTPQHLQMQDRFLEDQLEFRLAALTFCPWGFSRLEVDREALGGGTLSVEAAAGIFADGLLFDFPESDPGPAPKPLDDHWAPDRTSLDLFLTVPEYRIGGHNVSMTRGNGDTRYHAEAVLRRDENDGLNEKPIQVARNNVRILAEGESLEGSSSLPLARVVRTSTGAYELDPHFVPPLVNFAASDRLTTIARRLVELLSAKSAALGGARRQRHHTLADFGIADVADFWLLYTVNTHLPVVRHLYESARVHPAELYSEMLALGGALSTFSSVVHARGLPAYDHADLGGCFTVLDEQLRELLETVVAARHVSLQLQATGPSVYAVALDQERYFTAPDIFLAVKAGVQPQELLRKAPQLLKVSSAHRIEQLISQALPGLRLTPIGEAPGNLPMKLDYHYFALERTGADWEAVKLAGNLAVYVPSDFPNPHMELVIHLPPERR
jgi:type VI secretion system protein ImpJ